MQLFQAKCCVPFSITFHSLSSVRKEEGRRRERAPLAHLISVEAGEELRGAGQHHEEEDEGRVDNVEHFSVAWSG